MNQTSRAALVVLVSCLLLNGKVFAQIKASYHFGVIGSTGDTSARLSEPVFIQYSKCFDITNGLPRFAAPKFGAFAITCNEAQPKINLLVQVYPNPVVNELTIRSLQNYPEKGLTKYRVVLTDFKGNPIRIIPTDLSRINEGFKIQVGDLSMGYFVLTLYADKEIVQSFKILKAA